MSAKLRSLVSGALGHGSGSSQHTDVANVEPLLRCGQYHHGINGDLAQLAISLPASNDQLMGSSGEIEHFRSKLIDLMGAVTPPGDRLFGQPASNGNVRDNHKVSDLGVDVRIIRV